MRMLLGEPMMSMGEIERAYREATGKWTGCDWPTQFGRIGLNLYGLKARQAALLARATSGQEAADWRAAVDWLDQVERDAQTAQEMAGEALASAQNGKMAGANFHAWTACAIEAKYHSRLVWLPLQEAIDSALIAAKK